MSLEEKQSLSLSQLEAHLDEAIASLEAIIATEEECKQDIIQEYEESLSYRVGRVLCLNSRS